MKIRSRLIIAIIMMTILPAFIGFISFRCAMRAQTGSLVASYGLSPYEYESYGSMLDPIKVLYSLSLKDFSGIADIADDSPDSLMDKEFLDQISEKISKRDSFIVVRQNDMDRYIGDRDRYMSLSPLPRFLEYKKGVNDKVSLDRNNSVLIRQKDFYFSDNSIGQVFLITDMGRLMPYWKNSIRCLMFSFLIAIVIMGAILILWLYQGIEKPLKVLHVATTQIGEGNLDNPIKIASSDEIGKLCRDFEEMRVRLKSMMEELLEYEQNAHDMLASISHDLKTPLTAIKGYAEGLMDGVASTPDKQERYLKTIASKAADMTYLVDELSLFSKMEQNAMPYNFVALNVDEYFNDCIYDITFDLQAHNIKIVYENNTAPYTLITADPEQLRRVIGNIAENSVKYMDKEEGVVKISIDDVDSAKTPIYGKNGEKDADNALQRAKDEFIRVEISDNGPGIDESALPYIFDKFYRADESRNSSKGGSGLGLAIVKKIVLDHGGFIWAQSVPGKGTKISFTLRKKAFAQKNTAADGHLRRFGQFAG